MDTTHTSDIDAEHFIDEIKKRPAIWDSANKYYKNRQVKKNQWIELCKVFSPDFEHLDANVKLLIVKEQQSKWKRIRDSYVRSLRNQKTKSGQCRKDIKLFIYARQLEFLKSVITPAPTEASFGEGTENVSEDDGEEVEENDDSDASSPDKSERADVERNHQYSASTSFRRRKRRLDNKIEAYIDLHSKEKYSRTQEPSCDDMDFFRSLVPIIKPLPMNQKMRFKMEVMKLALAFSEQQEKYYVPMVVPTGSLPHAMPPSYYFQSDHYNSIPTIQHYPHHQNLNPNTQHFPNSQPYFPTAQPTSAHYRPTSIESQIPKEGGQSQLATPPARPSATHTPSTITSDSSEQFFNEQDFSRPITVKFSFLY